MPTSEIVTLCPEQTQGPVSMGKKPLLAKLFAQHQHAAAQKRQGAAD